MTKPSPLIISAIVFLRDMFDTHFEYKGTQLFTSKLNYLFMNGPFWNQW